MNMSKHQEKYDLGDDSEDEIIASVNFETEEITVLKHIYFKCTGCALCCIENKIPVTEREYAKIEEMEDIDVSYALESLSPILIPQRVISDSNRIKAYLIKKKPYSHECYFLGDKKMCKIHPVKPFACKMYPFSLRPDHDEAVKILIHPESVCQFIFDVKEEESNTEAIVEEIISIINSNMKEM
ncbi:MAG: YkgJ family cysteine cluster protein [Candidatus Heimdallarchaeota archaeon]|nr:YkgJ family cysteine cluster protein [Candidatus Heimdallarchaeota archaeon]MCK5048090.1 YkgJ family cysteine cluster protein [Candidatus Heimdallarchaeota archaeon]